MGNGNLIVPIERIENIEENIDELNTNYNRLNSDMGDMVLLGHLPSKMEVGQIITLSENASKFKSLYFFINIVEHTEGKKMPLCMIGAKYTIDLEIREKTNAYDVVLTLKNHNVLEVMGINDQSSFNWSNFANIYVFGCNTV